MRAASALARSRNDGYRGILRSYAVCVASALVAPNQREALLNLPTLPTDPMHPASLVMGPMMEFVVRLRAAADTNRVSEDLVRALAKEATGGEDGVLPIDLLVETPTEANAKVAAGAVAGFIQRLASPDGDILESAIEIAASARSAAILGSPDFDALVDQARKALAKVGSGTTSTIIADQDAVGRAIAKLSQAAKPCDRTEGLRPSEDRGYWGRWLAGWLSDRAGIMPGRNLAIGGGSGSGKTALACTLANDAISDGCAVHWVQLELTADEQIGSMLAQLIPMAGTTASRAAKDPIGRRMETIGKFDAAAHYADLLTVDGTHRSERADHRHIIAEIHRHVARVQDLRKRGAHTHACNGMIVIDYAQRIRYGTARSSQSEYSALSDACSEIQEAAAEAGVALIILSQLNKGAQRQGAVGDATSFNGIDLCVFDTAISVSRVAFDAESKAFEAWTDRGDDPYVKDLGVPRVITVLKERGTCPDYAKEDRLLPEVPIFMQNRMFHGDFRMQTVIDRLVDEQHSLIGERLGGVGNGAPKTSTRPARERSQQPSPY